MHGRSTRINDFLEVLHSYPYLCVWIWAGAAHRCFFATGLKPPDRSNTITLHSASSCCIISARSCVIYEALTHTHAVLYCVRYTCHVYVAEVLKASVVVARCRSPCVIGKLITRIQFSRAVYVRSAHVDSHRFEPWPALKRPKPPPVVLILPIARAQKRERYSFDGPDQGQHTVFFSL